MTIALYVATFLGLLAAGRVVGRLAGLPQDRPSAWLRDAPIGLGAFAVQGVVYSLVGLPFSVWTVAAIWFPIAFWSERHRPAVRAKDRKTTVAELGIIVIGLGLALIAWSSPIHTSDAANIYGLNARVFAESQGLDFKALRSLHFPGHIEYPPLLSLNLALLFEIDGWAATRLGLILLVLCWISLALHAFEIARHRIGWGVGLAATTILVLSPEVLNFARRAYGELPLAVYLSLIHI